MMRDSQARRRMLLVAMLAVLSLLASACAQSRLEEGGAEVGGGTITFWTRSNSEDFDKRLVEAWNATHDTKVKLTVIPSDLFVTKFSTAARGGNPPDVVASDIIYLPKFNQTQQFLDLTDRIAGLPYADDLVQAHMRLATWEGKQYAVPHNVDGSMLFYNKDLFEAAGLDPEKPPATWEEIYRYAKKITAPGKDTYGYYFAGNCSGCNAYTMLPMLWASDDELVSEDGSTASVPSEPFGDLLALYHRMWTEKLMPAGVKTDNGSTWQSTFLSGKIGMAAIGTFAIPGLKEQQKFEWGIAPLPGRDGGRSTFVGGDAIGIPTGSKHPDQAWEFIKWTLEERAQVEVIAKSGVLTARTDLTDNPHTAADPRVQLNNELLAEGRTPFVLPYNALFNDPNGPWLAMLRKGIFNGQADAAMRDGQAAFTKVLETG